jgi:hypothetical protein
MVGIGLMKCWPEFQQRYQIECHHALRRGLADRCMASAAQTELCPAQLPVFGAFPEDGM